MLALSIVDKSGSTSVQSIVFPKLTVPYTPEQDGVVERGFRTIFGRVRSIAIDCKIPKSLWPEPFKGMIYITNRTATSTLKDRTLIEALQRLILGDKVNRPMVSYIRVLGCKAYVHI